MEDINLQGQFNQAAFQQVRLNDLLNVINYCWINPTQYNFQYQDFNYRVVFRCLSSFYSEVRSFFTKEQEELDEIMENLDDFIEANPIVLQIKKQSSYGNKKGAAFNSESWRVIRKAIQLFKNKILKAAHDHDLLNPVREEDDGDTY